MAETDNMTPEQIAEAQRQNCIFCKIAKKEIPAKIVHETDKIICIMDINPASEGHLLIFPKEHYMILPHLPEDISSELFKTVKFMSKTLLKTLQCKGTSVFVANGLAAGQKGPHVLVHLFPRREGDGLLEFKTKDVDERSLKQMVTQLKPYIPTLLGDTSASATAELRSKREEKEENVEAQEDTEDEEQENVEDDEEEIKENKKKSSTKKRKKPDAKKDVKTMDLDEISKLFV